VAEFAGRREGFNEVRLVDGPRKGFVANFLTAICGGPEADFYAIADQDDVWGTGKLTRALAWLAKIETEKPALYCGRTQTADIEGNPIGLSPAFKRPPCFANALVQSIGGGNTMVMNRAARELICKAGSELSVVSHDWWIYQLVSGAGGTVLYDLQPSILYRQHGQNLVGESTSSKARLLRLGQMLRGRLQLWMDINLQALLQVKHLLTEENRDLLDELINLRQQSCVRRLVGIRKLRLERQTWFGNAGLALAAILGKF